MRIEHLKYLITIVDSGSINKASKALYINQQQLSKIVQNLEDDFGVQIFIRHSNGVELTEAGKDIYNAAISIVGRIEDLRLHLRKNKDLQGTLEISAALSYGDYSLIYQAYDRFNAIYPDVSLSINEMSYRKILENCQNHKSQIGYICFDVIGVVNDEVQIPAGWKFILLNEYKLGILVGKNSFLYDKNKVNLDMIKNEDFVVYTSNGESSFDDFFNKYGNKKYVVSKISYVNNLLKSKNVIALSIDKWQKNFKENNISFIALDENIVVYSGLIVPEDYQDNELLRAFVEICLEIIDL